MRIAIASLGIPIAGFHTNKKVIIVSSHKIADYLLVGRAVAKSGFEVTKAVSGADRSVDTLRELRAAKHFACVAFGCATPGLSASVRAKYGLWIQSTVFYRSKISTGLIVVVSAYLSDNYLTRLTVKQQPLEKAD